MSEPAKVRVKRRADEDGPDTLLLESRKRASTPLRYVRDLGRAEFAAGAAGSGDSVRVQTGQDVRAGEGEGTAVGGPVRRLFQLNKRKASSGGGGVATFVEKKVRRDIAQAKRVDDDDDAVGGEGGGEFVAGFETPMDRPLKPPSRRARVVMPEGKTAPAVETQAERQRMEELAEYMHQAALEEIKRERNTVQIAKTETKPNRVAAPRLSGQRSRVLHQQRVMSNNALQFTKNTETDSEIDYVYDTYVLAPTSDLGAVAQSSLGNVGYLVITEEDEPLWQSYLEDELSEEEGDSADEDENAEDFYGADYPEDELEIDDEFDFNAYGYRGRVAEDEEEWDGETGERSEDEGLEGRMGRLMYEG